MSIAIIDYIGNFIQMNILPNSVITLIVCNENTLVPSSLQATLLSRIDRNTISVGGLFIFRAGTELDKGCNIGLAYTLFPNSKLYTSRPELFSGIVPNNSLETLVQPFQTQKNPSQKVAEPSKSFENSIFEEVYLESLEKFSKTFLLIPSIRACKIKSLKAQLKNMVDGVIMSKARKIGKITLTSENVVESIFEDLEKQDILKKSFSNVEYNDILIEKYFGPSKSAIFIPGYRQSLSSQPIRQLSDPSKTLKMADQPTLNPEPRDLPKAFPIYTGNSSVTVPKVVQPILLVHKPTETLGNVQKVGITRNRAAEGALEQTTQGNQNNIITEDFDWSPHDEAISMLLIDEIGNSESIDSCLKLYRLCNGVIKDYMKRLNIEPGPDDLSGRITKAIRLSLNTFFLTDSKLSNEEIAANFRDNLNIKLTKNE